MTADSHEYLLGTDLAEAQRLGLQHLLWAGETLALWERCGFSRGKTVLDLGCGPGWTTIDLARIVGDTGRVIGIDVSSRYINHLRQRQQEMGLAQIDARVASAADFVIDRESLDGVYSRWVFSFLPNPADIVRRVATALRPGGVFAIQDYFNYTAMSLAPRSAVFDRLVAAISRSYREAGGDLEIAGKLPRMMIDAGLAIREIKPHVAAARPHESKWLWPDTFFANYVPRLVSGGFLSTEDAAAFVAEWAERSRDPGTFFFSPPFFDVVAVKPA